MNPACQKDGTSVAIVLDLCDAKLFSGARNWPGMRSTFKGLRALKNIGMRFAIAACHRHGGPRAFVVGAIDAAWLPDAIAAVNARLTNDGPQLTAWYITPDGEAGQVAYQVLVESAQHVGGVQ